jgi:hypothetical protein
MTSLHTTKAYQVEYGENAINGWDKIQNFINYLRNRSAYDEPCSPFTEVFINEDETEMEIPVNALNELLEVEEWKEVAETILANYDKRNDYAYLTIW